jgi:hypothetical protein
VRDISTDEALKYISKVKDSVDQEWLRKELQQIESYTPPKDKTKLSFIGYAERFHPLAFLIHQVDKQIQSLGSSQNVTEEMMRLAHLGESLSILRQSDTEQLNSKIRNLTVSPELFDKTVYELQVAAAYTRANHKIVFIEEKPEEAIQTPDMLIDDQVEVECKKKDQLSKRDRQNQEHWKLIMRKTSVIMNRLKCNYGIVIKTQRDPTKQDIEFILNETSHLIRTKRQGRFPFATKGIGVTVRKLADFNQEVKANSIQFGATEDLDFFTFAAEKNASQPVIRNPRLFGFKCATIPDRIKSVMESIAKAKEQVGGTKPGLIYVDLNSIDRRMMDADFRRLDSMIKSVLSNNSKISAVVITSEMFWHDAQGLVFTHRARVTKNDVARYPIPFKIVGEP